MSDLRQAAQQALEALEATHYAMIDAGLLDQDRLNENFTAHEDLRTGLEQQQAELVANFQDGVLEGHSREREYWSKRLASWAAVKHGVTFLMYGSKMAFKIGPQQFLLDYEPTEPGEFEYMRDAIIHALSHFTPSVNTCLLEQQAEPVAWGMAQKDGLILDVICPEEHQSHEGEYTIPLYTTPRQRKPMTDEQIDAAVKAWFENPIVAGRQPFAKRMRAAIEAAHNIQEPKS